MIRAILIANMAVALFVLFSSLYIFGRLGTCTVQIPYIGKIQFGEWIKCE